jgi:hypothetical protein
MVEENVNLVIEKEKEVTLLLVHDERMKDKENMWYLDNEANNHMYGNKDKFMEHYNIIQFHQRTNSVGDSNEIHL